jgi:hypothetical protein
VTVEFGEECGVVGSVMGLSRWAECCFIPSRSCFLYHLTPHAHATCRNTKQARAYHLIETHSVHDL